MVLKSNYHFFGVVRTRNLANILMQTIMENNIRAIIGLPE
jgi:hypothetical protein